MTDAELANQLISWAIGVPSLGVVIAYGISMIRRRVSSDSKSLNEDKTYGDMLEAYRKERDEIKADRDRIIARMSIIENERNEAIRIAGKLTAEVEFLSTQVTELKVLVEKLSITLELTRAEMQKFAIENVKLAAHVSYLEEVMDEEPLTNKP